MYDIEAINNYLTNNVVEEILSTLNIEYRKENGWLSVNCIWHDNADGFNLKWRDKKWYCFSQCNRAYSMYDFVGKILNLDFVESVKWIAEVIGLSDSKVALNSSKMAQRAKLQHMKALTKAKRKQGVKYKSVDQTILNDIEDYHHPYILNQGFKDNTLSYFNVGYARIGVFAKRVCFPIDAPDGTIISVSGRSVDDDIEPKYHILGSTDKALTLYNISRIDKNDNYIIIVEGMKSCMWFYENGLKSVVATMGSSITDEQVKLLLKLGRKVICVCDNDIAGQRLNQKIYNRLYKFLPVVKIDLGFYTDIKESSPSDLDFDEGDDLIEAIKGVINNV